MMLFKWKTLPKPTVQPLVEVFVRHCNYSSISAGKQRPSGFSKKVCFENLVATSRNSKVHFTYFLDVAVEGDHFLKGKAIEIREGTESGSFLRMLEYVERLDLHPDTIVYFLEDDYLHKPDWVAVLLEGFSLPVDYVTLYDHRDKYMHYPNLSSKILHTASCHWRTTPSTTNTYAMRFRTLKADYGTHERFSLGRKVTADHAKFCFLRKKGRVLISSMPGFSTHADPQFLSPCMDWTKLTHTYTDGG